MAIDKGNIKTSANYDVRAQKPMEARREKPRKIDLITKESWSYDGNTVYAHEGLQVWVPEEGKTYILKDLSKMFEPDYSGWDVMLTEGNAVAVDPVDIEDNLESIRTDAALSAKQGRVLNERINEVAAEATKIYNIKGSTEYDKLPMTGNAVGDVYNITDDFTLGGQSYPSGTNVVWDGSNWDALGGSIDLSNYYTKKEVTAMVQNESNRINTLTTSVNKAQSDIASLSSGKVDNVSGKGLSEEDFTAELKKKLEGLSDYDDSGILEDIESLQTQINTLANDDNLEDVIAKYEELKAFLESLDNTELDNFIVTISEQITTLSANLKTANSRIDGIVEDVENLAADKQDVLNDDAAKGNIKKIGNQSILGKGNIAFKTINNESIFGTGNITIEGGEGGGNASTYIIDTDINFSVGEEIEATKVNYPEGTHAAIAAAVEKGDTIVLRHTSGNTHYCIRVEIVLQRLLLHFKKDISNVLYEIIAIVGLDDTITYSVSRVEIASKDYVEDALAGIEGGGGDKEVYTIIWYGTDTPSELIEDNKKAYEAFVAGKDVSFRVVLMENNLPIFLTPDKIQYTGGTSMLIKASSAETHYGTTAGLGIIRYSMMLYNDGHIDHIGMDRFDVPTTDDVEEMIAQSGGSSTPEVFIGAEEPTDAKIWIDPSGTPSGGGGNSGGDSVAVDSALSKTSTNPVQNKVITEVLDNKANGRLVYAGLTEEEVACNLETLRLLDEGFTGNIVIIMDGVATALSYGYKNNVWAFNVLEIMLFGGDNSYIYIDEQGIMQIQMDEDYMLSLFYGSTSFAFPVSNDHRALVFGRLLDSSTAYSELQTIAKSTGQNGGAAYFTAQPYFDDTDTLVGVLAYCYDNGLRVDTIDVSGAIVDSVKIPIRLYPNNSTNIDLALHFMKYGDNNLSISIDGAIYAPICIKNVDKYDGTQGYLITIMRDEGQETYLLKKGEPLTLYTNS